MLKNTDRFRKTLMIEGSSLLLFAIVLYWVWQ